MAYEIRFTARALLRCRFAISPVWETTHLVKLLLRSGRSHVPWLEAVRPRAAGLQLADIAALHPVRGWTPDFLTPTPEGPGTTIGEELARVRATGTEAVVADLLRTRQGQRDPGSRARIARMLDEPAAARDRLAETIQQCWDTLVAPDWPPLRELLAADIARSSRTLAEGGLERLLPELHSGLSLRQDTLVIRKAPAGQELKIDRSGLVLMPSAFVWPRPAIVLDVPRPAIVYPARGIGELRRAEEEPEALAMLLGRRRATLLTALAEPASTSALARRHGMSPSGVSAHLAVLRESGLVNSWRDKHEVLYQQTELGAAVVRAQSRYDRPFVTVRQAG